MVPPGRELASRVIAIMLAVSFAGVLVPIASASRDKANVMACCIGKEAGHCDSGLTAQKPPPPPPEPMCGLTSTSLDAVTIVAESSTEAENAESEVTASVSKPCPMSCGACTATTSRLQKRQKEIIQVRKFHSSSSQVILRFENPAHVFSSNQSRTGASPRGPPSLRFSSR
jgi:hypothetical protein